MSVRVLGCNISPAGYSQLTALLAPLAGGKILVCLEGGYNLRSIARSSEACLRVLLGEPALPLPQAPDFASDVFGRSGRRAAAFAAIDQAIENLAPYWPVLGGLRRPAPSEDQQQQPSLFEQLPALEIENSTSSDDNDKVLDEQDSAADAASEIETEMQDSHVANKKQANDGADEYAESAVSSTVPSGDKSSSPATVEYGGASFNTEASVNRIVNENTCEESSSTSRVALESDAGDPNGEASDGAGIESTKDASDGTREAKRQCIEGNMNTSIN